MKLVFRFAVVFFTMQLFFSNAAFAQQQPVKKEKPRELSRAPQHVETAKTPGKKSPASSAVTQEDVQTAEKKTKAANSPKGSAKTPKKKN